MKSSPDRKPSLVLCALVLGAVAVLCLVSAVRGNQRFGQYTYYFYDNGDPGHPGLVNVVATSALLSISAISAFLASTLRRSPWLVNAVLFFVISIDYLVRAHNQFRGGDVLARIVYLSVLVYVLQRMWYVRTSNATRVLVLAGLGFFVLSDVIDLLSRAPYGRSAVLEESTGCLGGWCLALALFGVAQTSLCVAERLEPQDEEL